MCLPWQGAGCILWLCVRVTLKCINEEVASNCLTAWGQWTVQLLQCTASLPGGSGQWNAMQCLTAWGQWAVQLLQCTASLPGGSGQCNSCNTLSHCAWAQRAVQLMQCTAPLPGAVGSATAAIHCLTA